MNNELKRTASSVLKLIEDGEKISIQLFANKLAKASNAYPEDHTIGMMAGVVARMAGSKLFISRAEIKDLYKRLYSRNTKFASLFADELGEIVKVAEPVKYNREHDDETGSVIEKAYEKLVDPVLANALHNAFGNKTTAYSETFAKTAKELCTRGLSEFAATVEVATGREDVVVCRASFDTPKGKTSVFIPVEVIAGKVVSPSVFVGNAGPEDLTRENVKNYIVANVGKKLTVSDSLVLAAVSNIKDGDLSKLSNVDIALTKLNATKEAPADFSQGQVLYQRVDTEATNVEVSTPGYTTDPTFAEKFDTALGIASYKFTAGKVKLGRDIISRHLTGYGFANHQVSVCDSNENTIFYAVALDGGKVAFRVPIRIQDGKMLAPTMLISNGSVEAFSDAGIKSLFVKAVDYHSAAAASPLFIKKASELVEVVRVAAEQKDYATAEEALNILATSDDAKAYAAAFDCYTRSMSGEKAVETKCSHIVRNATSKHDLCGHTGLPLHKVWQDRNGNCMAKYRQAMNDTYEGAYFMNSQVFFPTEKTAQARHPVMNQVQALIHALGMMGPNGQAPTVGFFGFPKEEVEVYNALQQVNPTNPDLNALWTLTRKIGAMKWSGDKDSTEHNAPDSVRTGVHSYELYGRESRINKAATDLLRAIQNFKKQQAEKDSQIPAP